MIIDADAMDAAINTMRELSHVRDDDPGGAGREWAEARGVDVKAFEVFGELMAEVAMVRLGGEDPDVTPESAVVGVALHAFAVGLECERARRDAELFGA